jgi:hypothetical protein
MEAELYRWEDAENGWSVKTLFGSSPYTREFKGIYEEVRSATEGKCSQVKSIPLPQNNRNSSGQLHGHLPSLEWCHVWKPTEVCHKKHREDDLEHGQTRVCKTQHSPQKTIPQDIRINQKNVRFTQRKIY